MEIGGSCSHRRRSSYGSVDEAGLLVARNTGRMKFDDVLGHIGEFGPYQKWVFFLTLLTNIHGGVFLLHTVFTLGDPSHRCALEGYPNDTYAIQSDYQSLLLNKTIPVTEGTDSEPVYDECHVITGNVTYDETNRPINGTPTKCSEWVYDTSVFKSTFVSEFDLVCEKEIYSSNAGMLFYAGMLVGSVVSGIASDRYGRKPTTCIALTLMLGSSVGISFAPSYAVFVVLLFILGGSVLPYFMSAYLIGLEIVGPSKRVLAGVLGNFLYIVGYLLIGGIAYALRDWKYTMLSASCPAAIFLLFWWLLPESPRWLLLQGRRQEAEKILRRIAKSNHTSLPDKMLESVVIETDSDQGKFWLLFTNRTMCVRTLILLFDWFACSLAYFGLSLHVGSLNGNFYLDYTLYGLVEIPAYLLCILLLDRVGRRLMYCVPFVVGGLACLSTIFTTIYGGDELYPVTMTLATCGKFGVTISYSVAYVFSAELFPTAIRNAGLGSSSLAARVGGMIAPYLVNIGDLIGGDFGEAFPLMIVGSVSVLSGLLNVALPETLNRQLPETMEDVENFGKDGRQKISDTDTCSREATVL